MLRYYLVWIIATELLYLIVTHYWHLFFKHTFIDTYKAVQVCADSGPRDVWVCSKINTAIYFKNKVIVTSDELLLDGMVTCFNTKCRHILSNKSIDGYTHVCIRGTIDFVQSRFVLRDIKAIAPIDKKMRKSLYKRNRFICALVTLVVEVLYVYYW